MQAVFPALKQQYRCSLSKELSGFIYFVKPIAYRKAVKILQAIKKMGETFTFIQLF